ncbi:MAG: S46 family peptidase [Limisphaerales bacterium]
MKFFPILLTSLVLVLPRSVGAEEGMWLVNQPPRQLLWERHAFLLSDRWLDRARGASVSFGGGSGSFVSEDGLLISNHHVVAGAIEKLSTAQRDLMRDGFLARTPAAELPCPDLEISVLHSIEDVTARVNAAVPEGTDTETALAARRRVIAEIERESHAATGLRSEVVTLWQGGAYHLYRAKRYTDVRLVFAPERQVAFFGGDADNFEYPRFCLDVAFLRAYENGRPAKVEHWFQFNPAGAREGELVLVTGHPGRTSRLLTVAELEHLRDVVLPFSLQSSFRQEVLLANWSERHVENARRANRSLMGVQNGRKATAGRLAGLLDPALMNPKREAEARFQARIAARPELADARAAFDRIATATRVPAEQHRRHTLLEGGRGFQCESFRLARTLLRAAEERPKPDGERLREFTDARRPSLELTLFSPKPIYEDLETLLLADALTALSSELGANDPLVEAVLAGLSPRARAAALIRETRVRDVAFRRALYEGGAAAVQAANDPMIELARLVDGPARELRRQAEARGEIRQQAHAALARARLALDGADGYPDATGTLRLAFGTVRGGTEAGQPFPAFTTTGGLFARAAAMNRQPPFDLPESWERHRRRLSSSTPFNFVTTADTIGGNSGSPVLNRAGELVGVIFDGNLASLPWDYAYNDAEGRSLAVHAAIIVEALQKVYGARALVRELTSGRLGR